jgi:hypothetical protein
MCPLKSQRMHTTTRKRPHFELRHPQFVARYSPNGRRIFNIELFIV